MTILQVNVRPAGKSHRLVGSQRSEQAEQLLLNQSNYHLPTLSPADLHVVDLGALPLQSSEQYMVDKRSTKLSTGEQVASAPLLATTTPVMNSSSPMTKNAESTALPAGVIGANEQRNDAGNGREKLANGAVDAKLVPITASYALVNEAVPTAAEPLLKAPSTWQKIIWKLMPFTTVGRALNSARERLNEAGCNSASLDAQVILAYVLSVDRSWLFAHHDYKLGPEQADAFTDLIARRMAHEPVAYLVGKREFYGLDFLVDQRVLIPRPETELLVDAVLDIVADREDERIIVADVGTGSGAIALSIAHNCPHTRIYAIDLSDDALAVAHSNVERLDERGQVTLAHGDLLTPLPERAHVIVANLPYISSAIYPQLDADVRDFEPQLALEAGPEGLDAIHRLLHQAAHFLLPDGVILLEIGYDQGSAVSALAHHVFPHAQLVSVRKDYHGHDRLVTIIP